MAKSKSAGSSGYTGSKSNPHVQRPADHKAPIKVPLGKRASSHTERGDGTGK